MNKYEDHLPKHQKMLFDGIVAHTKVKYGESTKDLKSVSKQDLDTNSVPPRGWSLETGFHRNQKTEYLSQYPGLGESSIIDGPQFKNETRRQILKTKLANH